MENVIPTEKSVPNGAATGDVSNGSVKRKIQRPTITASVVSGAKEVEAGKSESGLGDGGPKAKISKTEDDSDAPEVKEGGSGPPAEVDVNESASEDPVGGESGIKEVINSKNGIKDAITVAKAGGDEVVVTDEEAVEARVSEGAENLVEEKGDEKEGVKEAKKSEQDVSAEIERKKLRAERFGVELALTEDEKRKARASRFGTANPQSDLAAKKSERAKKFGIVEGDTSAVSSVDKELEAAKKKARLERFGVVSATTKVLTAEEEEKKKAREARFGSVADASGSEAKGELETKKAARAARFASPPVKAVPET